MWNKRLVLLMLLPLCLKAANTCASGSIANAYCQPEVINHHLIAVNRTGDTSNSEVECYNPQNVFIDGGNLIIQSRKLTQTCNNSGEGGTFATPTTMNYTSGYLMTYPFAQKYGDWKVRAKMPSNVGAGSWPAIWMIGSGDQPAEVSFDTTGLPCSWPNAGCEEIDVAEFRNGHSGGYETYALFNSFYESTSNSCTFGPIADASQNWHIYELLWTSAGFHVLIDGQATNCSGISGDPIAGPMFLVLNNAIGGTGGGTINDATWPQTMQVDWIQICSAACNGNNATFYEDFVTPVAPVLLTPLARIGRLAGLPLAAGTASVMSGSIGISGNAGMRFR